MASVLIDESIMTSIADAIRNINGESTKYYPSEVPSAILNLIDNEGASRYIDGTTTKCIGYPITSLSSSAFYNRTDLKTVSFSECTTIGSYAFAYCTALESAYFMASKVASLNTSVFYSTPMVLSSFLGHYGSIYVPFSLLASYQEASNWSDYSDRMVGI